MVVIELSLVITFYVKKMVLNLMLSLLIGIRMSWHCLITASDSLGKFITFYETNGSTYNQSIGRSCHYKTDFYAEEQQQEEH